MAADVLFDYPGPTTRARHRVYTVIAVVLLILVVGLVIWRLQEAGQFAYDLWEPYITPVYVQALMEGLLDTLKMAFTAILGAVVFGLVFGVGKLSDHGFLRWPSWLVVEFFRAVPVLMLMIFFFYAVFGGLSIDRGRLLGCGHRAHLLQRRCPCRGLPGGHQRRAEGPARGGVRPRHAQGPGHEHHPAAAGGQDHDPGDHQPVRGGAEGHQPRLHHRRARPHPRRPVDLPRVQPTTCRPSSCSPCSTSAST